jgi:hypothetical protein
LLLAQEYENVSQMLWAVVANATFDEEIPANLIADCSRGLVEH